MVWARRPVPDAILAAILRAAVAFWSCASSRCSCSYSCRLAVSSSFSRSSFGRVVWCCCGANAAACLRDPYGGRD